MLDMERRKTEEKGKRGQLYFGVSTSDHFRILGWQNVCSRIQQNGCGLRLVQLLEERSFSLLLVTGNFGLSSIPPFPFSISSPPPIFFLLLRLLLVLCFLLLILIHAHALSPIHTYTSSNLSIHSPMSPLQNCSLEGCI